MARTKAVESKQMEVGKPGKRIRLRKGCGSSNRTTPAEPTAGGDSRTVVCTPWAGALAWGGATNGTSASRCLGGRLRGHEVQVGEELAQRVRREPQGPRGAADPGARRVGLAQRDGGGVVGVGAALGGGAVVGLERPAGRG
jgi:hypothetical protein